MSPGGSQNLAASESPEGLSRTQIPHSCPRDLMEGTLGVPLSLPFEQPCPEALLLIRDSPALRGTVPTI